MKILIPVIEFGNAGGYRVLSNLANEWTKMGHSVDFLSPIASIRPYFPTVASIYWVNKDGAMCTEADLIHPKGYKFWHRWKALRKGIENLPDNYDIILANHSLTAFPVVRADVLAKKFYYIQAYEPEYGMLNGSLSHKTLSLISRQSYNLNLVKIVNASIYKNYKNIVTNKVVLPGLDLGVFYKKEFTKAGECIKVGCVGRVEPYKGTSFVLDAFKILRAEMSNIELHIAFGDQQLHGAYEGVFVNTPGSDSELADFYRSMDIIVAPGTIQLGAVHYPVIEAMACGTPVITTGYYPAEENNAWIVPVKDAEAIVKEIKNVVADDNERKRKIDKANDDVQIFKWEMVASKMINYFLE
jgi:glycosyltransferase involved in cell wall biosynthesis